MSVPLFKHLNQDQKVADLQFKQQYWRSYGARGSKTSI